MTARTLIPALLVPLTFAMAQTARETPPDQKAYAEASRTADPAKKIAALEKFKLDFPKSNYAQMADNSILSALLKDMPDQKARVRKTAAAIYKAAALRDKEASRGGVMVTTRNRESAALRIAEQFLSANVFLKDAEGWAKRSIEPMRENVWMSEQRESLAKRKQPIPAQGELIKRFNEQRATRQGVLGQIEWKLGREAEAKKLLETAYAASQSNVAVAAALGEIARKDGDDAKALDYLIPVRLSGHAPASASEAFESIYRKLHGGSLDGVEAMLDREYRKRLPNPVHVEAYKPDGKRSDRVVLGEVFTGSGCPPCAGADLAFDAAMERFAHKDFAVVMYHQHIPRPDPMTTPETTARAKFYEVRGVPTFAVDGADTIGGGSREMAKGIYDRLITDVEKDLDSPAEAHVRLNAALTGAGVHASVVVDGVKGDAKDVRVQILLVEKEIRFNGENGIRFHPMVVRAFGGGSADGFKLDGAGGSFEASFDLDAVSKAIKQHLDEYEAKGHRGESFKFAEKKYQIDRKDLAVVAFVQDAKTRHILQAAWADLAPAAAHPTTEANTGSLR